MIILDLCGGTGAWSEPYRKAGYDVRLITLPDHDILEYEPPSNVAGVLFAPPCTVWANSGARWWATRSPDEILESVAVLVAGLRIIQKCKPLFYAIENPIGKMKRLLGEPRLIFDPWEYGDPYTKKTLLWGNFTIPMKLFPTPPTEGSKMHLRYGGKSERTKRERSRTPEGFAISFFEVNNPIIESEDNSGE